MKNETQYDILLFYKYIDVEDPKILMYEQRTLCEKLGFKGRMIIAHEGMNATLEGTKENIEKYCKKLTSDPRFADTHFKISGGTGDSFPRLSIKVRKDIVSDSFGAQVDVDPRKTTGKRLSGAELHQWLQTKPESFQIVDMRNDYEFRVGHFKGSILPGLKNFRDLPKAKEEISHLKDKTIVTVCTGGVRCEKASGYLIKNGFKDVYQLDGGIVSYMEKYPSQDFVGSLYVFDKRITMHFNDPEKHIPIGKCDICDVSSERYVNCTLDTCHDHFICCQNCENEQSGDHFCSKNCQESNK